MNSYNPSHGQRIPNDQQYYKTTIPINEQHHLQQQQQCTCNSNGTTQTADGKELTAAAIQKACHGLCDVTIDTQQRQRGISSTTPSSLATAAVAIATPVCGCSGMRNAQANENHTTAATTTTTTIEYELSNGTAKLSKISTSRVAAEPPPSTTAAVVKVPPKSESLSRTNTPTDQDFLGANSKLPLLSQVDLNDLMRNVNAINAVNRTLHHYSFANQQQQQGKTPLSSTSAHNLQHRSNFHMDFSSMNGSSNSPLKKVPRDRLGLWGTGGDVDVPGNISGLQRLQQKKYNKVRG